MPEFGVNILQTDYWTPKAHLHVDRGRYIRPSELDTIPAGTTQGYVKVDPPGAGWTHAFAGVAGGNINGSGSPFVAGSDFQLVNFQPVAPTLQSAASVAIKPPGAPAQTWRQEFINRLTTFRGGIRVMDLCATQSDFQTARDPAAAGSWSGMRRRCPNTYTDGVRNYPWQSANTWSIDELAALDEVVSEIFVNMPPLLTLPGNETERDAWLSAFASASFTRVWVGLGNEVWNAALGGAPYYWYLETRSRLGRLGGGDVVVGMAEYFSERVLELQAACAAISPKLTAVIEWQSTNLWPFVRDPWSGGRPVNKTCYDALNQIGHMFIAPYFTEPTAASVQQQLDLITQWREPPVGQQVRGDLDARGVMLHAYEAGQHFDATQPVSVQTAAATLVLWDTYLRGLHQRMDPHARCYLYGLVSPSAWTPGNCWGLLEDIATDNAKWTQVKTTIEAIRLLAPVLP